jgi:hypothetical protein
MGFEREETKLGGRYRYITVAMQAFVKGKSNLIEGSHRGAIAYRASYFRPWNPFQWQVDTSPAGPSLLCITRMLTSSEL